MVRHEAAEALGAIADTHTVGLLREFATDPEPIVAHSCVVALDVLDYDWPCGFARFEIAIWNPERDWFGDEELASIGHALGHPVKQIRAHI